MPSIFDMKYESFKELISYEVVFILKKAEFMSLFDVRKQDHRERVTLLHKIVVGKRDLDDK